MTGTKISQLKYQVWKETPLIKLLLLVKCINNSLKLRWSESCVLIGYPSRQDGPFCPLWLSRVCSASKSSLFLLQILYDWPSLFGQDSWILTPFLRGHTKHSSIKMTPSIVFRIWYLAMRNGERREKGEGKRRSGNRFPRPRPGLPFLFPLGLFFAHAHLSELE